MTNNDIENYPRFYDLCGTIFKVEKHVNSIKLQDGKKKVKCLRCGIIFMGSKSNRICGSCSAANACSSTIELKYGKPVKTNANKFP